MTCDSAATLSADLGPSLAEFNAQHNFTEAQAYIYGLHDPRTGELRYIGKSVRPLERLGNHINEHSNTHRGHWLDALHRLELRPILVIIDAVPVSSDWQSVERTCIAAARKAGHRLTNGTDGGDGVSGLSPEIRARMAATWTGRKHSPETLALMSVNRKGRRHTIALRLHMSNVMRGRQFSPEHLHNLRRGVQKLTDDQVREIRRRLNAGESQYVIASAFGIHQGSVSNIFRGKTYGDVSPTKWRQKVRAGAHKLTDAQVREIRQRLSAGESQYAIADLFGVHQGSVSGIFRRKTYRDVS